MKAHTPALESLWGIQGVPALVSRPGSARQPCAPSQGFMAVVPDGGSCRVAGNQLLISI